MLELLASEGFTVTALERLDPGPGLPAAEVVVGDAGDPSTVSRALHGVDGVIHLAALPSPDHGPAEEVFTANTRATFVVLEAAGRAGIRRAAIASSYAVAGWTFGTRPVLPEYLPLDAAVQLRISDPYALSKQSDENTAVMMARRHTMSVVSLRLPFIGEAAESLPRMAERYTRTPVAGATEVWSYLDERDAARAFLHALRASPGGSPAVYVAAPETLAPYPTEWLLDSFLPKVPRRTRFPGRTVPIDLTPARRLLGFTATHPFTLG